ncbi:hypothetical protein Slin15195_G130030 [Septoria linicola]|uniref:Uncharacterized protein n=1 Tax=Septoria linicola TaxID=215465 RepID=A0A9Q9ERA2_9PEZI|nr:hypothetical protein Slin15195_G130030 [Septoria linicola]
MGSSTRTAPTPHAQHQLYMHSSNSTCTAPVAPEASVEYQHNNRHHRRQHHYSQRQYSTTDNNNENLDSAHASDAGKGASMRSEGLLGHSTTPARAYNSTHSDYLYFPGAAP